MTDRSRRVRRQISDVTDEVSDDSDLGSGEDYDPRRADSMRRGGRYDLSTNTGTASSRPRRGEHSSPTNGSASVQRASGIYDDRRQSLKLTVKAPPSKLREVMRANEVDALHDVLGGGMVLDGPRSTRRQALAASAPRQTFTQTSKPRYTEVPSDDDDEDDEDDDDEEDEEEDEEDEEEEEEDEEDEDEEVAQNDFDELGAEPEGGTDDDEDVEMEEAPPPPPPKRLPQPKAPKITLKPPARFESQTAKAKLVVTPANVGPVKSVEDQEMEDDPDDDEVEASSELSEEEDDGTNLNVEDGEGEDEDAEAEEEGLEEGDEIEVDDDDDDLDSDSDGTPASGSATPDISRMTKRQRRREEDANALLSLDMAPQQRKFFTDEEKAMRKDEHARKRKELTKRKVQEEKTAALNRLLKPQASKARGAAPKPETLAAAAAAAASPFELENAVPNANPVYTRWISSKDGIKLGVPEEWLGKKAGSYFGPSLTPSNRNLIQEVE